MEWEQPCQLEALHNVSHYVGIEVLLDTTGETSEIGWLTYPPGGVSATPLFEPILWPTLYSRKWN